MNRFIEFISYSIVTPIMYAIYSIFAILFTFALGLPVAIGIYFIQMFIRWIFDGGFSYANL
jgi:hypothetical protein